jgi:hypothetical protein
MKLLIFSAILVLTFSLSAFAQMSGGEPTERDKTAAIPSDSYLKRGDPIGNAKR